MKNLRQKVHEHLHLGRAQVARVEQRPHVGAGRAKWLQHGHQATFAQGLQHGDTVGGATLDASFQAARIYGGHVVSCLGWGTFALSPLTARAATYSGVFTLLPLLSGENHARHGAILREANKLIDAGKLNVRLDPRRFSLHTVHDAHMAQMDGSARGKLVVEVQD